MQDYLNGVFDRLDSGSLLIGLILVLCLLVGLFKGGK